jgi:hypothetical protein
MATLPPGVTVVTPSVTQPAYRIDTTAAGTPGLVSTYLTPILTGLGITPPTGYQVSNFNFTIKPNGSSTATIGWVATPAPTS